MSDQLPPYLVYLEFGDRFNQCIDLYLLVLPPTLKYLKFGEDFDSKLEPGIFPSSLTHLQLGYRYNHPFESGLLPETLTHLKIGRFQLLKKSKRYFGYFSENGHWTKGSPPSDENLPKTTPFLLDFLPSSLVKLDIGNCLYSHFEGTLKSTNVRVSLVHCLSLLRSAIESISTLEYTALKYPDRLRDYDIHFSFRRVSNTHVLAVEPSTMRGSFIPIQSIIHQNMFYHEIQSRIRIFPFIYYKLDMIDLENNNNS